MCGQANLQTRALCGINMKSNIISRSICLKKLFRERILHGQLKRLYVPKLAHGPGFADHFYKKAWYQIHTDNKYTKEVKYSWFKKPTFNIASLMQDKSFPFLPFFMKMCAYRCKLTTAIHSATLLISHCDKGCKNIQNLNEISSSQPGKNLPATPQTATYKWH